MLFTPLKPMLLSNIKKTPVSLSDPAVLYEPKYDGWRLLVHKKASRIEIFTRHGNVVTERFPDIVEAAVEGISAHSAILDCEGTCFHPDSRRPEFSVFDARGKITKMPKIVAAMRRHPATLVAFDLLMVDNEQMGSYPILMRKKKLSEIIRPSNSLIPTAYKIGDGRQLFEWTLINKWEGICAKHLNAARYHFDSRPETQPEAWVKIKHTQFETVFIMGYQLSPFQLLVGLKPSNVSDPYPVALVKFGFNNKDIREFLMAARLIHTVTRKNTQMIAPLIRCKVEYLEKTSNGALRDCTFRGFIAN
ncbi:ATP-dependent DNA ligase [Paenibacillus sp. GYB003]|uniref:ATP-dependent DNA ligase n=1 Tax=Paenibacillus sp. GYB003 TaxID=2994392 RepID=UPI002F96B097